MERKMKKIRKMREKYEAVEYWKARMEKMENWMKKDYEI